MMDQKENLMAQPFRVYSDMVLFGGISIRTKPHALHAVKIILSKTLPVTVVHRGQHYTGRGLILRSDIVHETLAQASSLFLYLDTEGIMGRQFSILLKDRGIISVEDDIAVTMLTFLGNAIAEDCPEAEIKRYLSETFFSHNVIYSSNSIIDDRVNRAISYIHLNLRKITTMKELTEVACLSESRLFHLFKKEIGIPIRKYILWCRIRNAIKLVIDGNSLTQSAKLSGFSDVAHLNRTFVFFFGMSPSHILKNTFN